MKNADRAGRPGKKPTPILDTYRIVYTSMPDHPEIIEYISPKDRIRYINTAAGPDAKITQMI